MSSNKKYWKSVEELNENSSIVDALRSNEFVEEIPTDSFLGDADKLNTSGTSRRDFLKYVGFSTAAATLAACEGPVHRSIPYVVQPESVIPGVADYYATTVFDGFDFANVLVKTREGRPIKIENNKSAGAVFAANARVNASILGLYDNNRIKQPSIKGKASDWTAVNAEVTKALTTAKGSGKQVVLLTPTIASPTTSKLIAEFLVANPTAKHVMYDAVSSSAALDAYQQAFGTRGLVDYDFSKADVVVGVGADFLGDWQGGGYDKGYAAKRVPKNGKMSKHFQFEANLTLSGAAADKRIPMSNYQQIQALLSIYGVVTGSGTAGNVDTKHKEEVAKAAKQLKAAGSKGLLVCGIDDKNAQLLTLAINDALSSEAYITAGTRLTRQGSNAAVAKLLADMNAGNVGVLISANVNPVYSLPKAYGFEAALKKVSTSVFIGLRPDETAVASSIVIGSNHYLESWADFSLLKGSYALAQPTIRPLFSSNKQFEDVLLAWTGRSNISFYDYLKANFATVSGGLSWGKVLHDGVNGTFVAGQSSSVNVADAVTALAAVKNQSGFELNFYSKVGMGDGQHANNPWLQEFPDPITRVSWDNYITISKADADTLGLENFNVANGGLNGSYVDLTVGSAKLEKVPVIIQPGQAKGTIGLSFGYGKKEGLKEEMQVGVNAFALYQNFKSAVPVNITKAEGVHEFACVQLHKTLMGRGDIVKETSLEIFNTQDASKWNVAPMVSLDHSPVKAVEVDLWESFDRSTGHHFNLSIDLNSCTGCGACVIACHAENNVPVVGKSEVRRSRDMHWLRIDRYYSSETTFEGDNEKKEGFDGLTGEKGSLGGFLELESASENPQVAFQPVMCQHCNHAPCETVCPVAATSHSRQGQNHMSYNRCVGTRYCANNCPYKVRRFNWFLYNNNDEFNYHMNDDLGKMVLNPDVNVRSRGVMEKCSMCIQMTQATILEAKRTGREVKADEFETACSSACNTGAMKFGDINNKESEVAALVKDDRMYHLLEHVGTKPNVIYHVKVRNV